jgi:uncharacterized protein
LEYKRLSRGVIFLIILITTGAFYLISGLGFDYDFEKFFPKGDQETQFYFDFRETFRTDNDFVLVSLTNESGIFDQDFLLRADSLATELSTLDHVEHLFSPTQLSEPIIDPLFGTKFSRPLIHMDHPESYALDSLNLYNGGNYVGTLVGESGHSICIQLLHKEYLSKNKCDTLAANVVEKVGHYQFDDVHIIGRSLGQGEYIQIMQNEMAIFISLSILLIVLFLFIAFRSAWGIWVPVSVVLLAIIWTLGVIKLIGKDIDVMLSILPTIIFVVGMSDVVHIVTRYYEELRNGKPKFEALKVTFKQIGMATFLTSLTTAVGFLTLMSSSIEPIKDFGLYTAIGVFLAYILAFSLLPAILILHPVPKITTGDPQKVFWTRKLHHSFLWIIKHRRELLLFSTILGIVALAGISQIKVNNFILEDLRPNHHLVKEFNYFADEYAGARPFEVAVSFPDPSDMKTLETLKLLDTLEHYLRSDYGAGSIISPVQLVKSANKSYNGGRPTAFRLPDSQQNVDKLFKSAGRLGAQDPFLWVMNDSAGWMRIGGKCADLGRKVYNQKNVELNHFISTTLADAPFEVKVTGTGHLIDLNNEQLSFTMIKGLLIAFLIVALIVGLLYRSLKMVIIALIPNILPLILIAGVMGYTGINLKVSTSIIFTIAFGIAVDDSIHFLSKFRLQLSERGNWLYALKRTYISTGKAIVVTTIILCAGFLTLIFSSFLGTFYVGLLISLALVFAVLADLFVLPVLLLYFFRKK